MKPEIYAQAMMIHSRAGKAADEIVSGAIKSLKGRGLVALLPKILSSYERLVQKAGAKSELLTIARQADEDGARQKSNASADAQVRIDENLIGGYRYESAGSLVDNSFKAKLLEVYRSATKA